jgi:hypothetical protein
MPRLREAYALARGELPVAELAETQRGMAVAKACSMIRAGPGKGFRPP